MRPNDSTQPKSYKVTRYNPASERHTMGVIDSLFLHVSLFHENEQFSAHPLSLEFNELLYGW